jgi:hypothetical protein
MNKAFCELLGRSVDRNLELLVVKWSNWPKPRRLDIPTASLAIERFQAAVAAHRSDWLGAGALSVSHFALVLPSLARVQSGDLLEAMDLFASDSFRFEILAALTPLANSVNDTFARIDLCFSAQELEDGIGGHPTEPNHGAFEDSNGCLRIRFRDGRTTHEGIRPGQNLERYWLRGEERAGGVYLGEEFVTPNDSKKR